MRKLLKILSVIGLTTPLSVNIIACGSGSSADTDNEVSENPNVQELLVKAKEQIVLGLGNLSEDYKNLTFEDEFPSGDEITTFLNGLPTDKDTKIENESIKDTFLKRLQIDINNSIIDKYLMEPSDLKPLFNNIPINEVLKIDINQTTFTKTVFQWDRNAEFGVAGYDPATYKITMWHQLTAGLQLKLTYKNESNMKSTIDVTNDFKFNYANKGADIRRLIDASTAKVEESLKGFIVEVNTTTAADSFNNLKSEVKSLLLAKLRNKKIDINNVDPVAKGTLNKYDKYVGGDYMYGAITKPIINEAISSLQTYLTPSVTTFKENLTNWIGTGANMKDIKVNKDNINRFGICTISNWSISGLTLKPMTLDFVNARSNQTQAQWVEQTGVALAKIFYSKGEFGQGRIDLVTDGNLTIYMNPNDFDDFVRQDKKMSDISDYITMKVSDKARTNGVLQKNISLTLNGLWENKPNPTLSNTKFVEKVDDNTFKIARNAGIENERMHGYNYLAINYDDVTFQSGSVVARNNNHILFNNWIIKKANTNVW